MWVMLEVKECSGEADEQLSLGVYNDVWPHDAITMDEVRSFKASVIGYVDCLAVLDRSVAGSAVAVVFPQRADRVFTLVTVLPEHRRHGVGSALYGAVSAWTVGRGLHELEAPVLDNDPDSLAFGESRGFVEERRELGVVLHLSGIDPPPVVPPDGVQIVTWAQRPELTRGLYEVACEALPDIPGAEGEAIEPFEDWLAHEMQGSGDRPDATFVAVAGDEVVGYAKFSLTAAQPTTAHHDLSGVKRAWRGRGVARALKAAQINWALANGYRELRTRNEQRNEPIRRLNAQFGYRPGIGRIYLVGPVATPRPG
jgi:GNAT superfamily N-acetyltransferase